MQGNPGAVGVIPRLSIFSQFAIIKKAGVDMFLAGIIGDELVGPFRVVDGIKITTITCIYFLNNNLILWYKKKTLAMRRSGIFMQDDATSHSTKVTEELLYLI